MSIHNPKDDQMATVSLPPPQYDFPPQIPVIERVLELSDLQMACFDLHYKNGSVAPNMWPSRRGNMGWRGCSVVVKRTDGRQECHVWRVVDDDVRRHEFGHCNGWPADHPGGRE